MTPPLATATLQVTIARALGLQSRLGSGRGCGRASPRPRPCRFSTQLCGRPSSLDKNRRKENLTTIYCGGAPVLAYLPVHLGRGCPICTARVPRVASPPPSLPRLCNLCPARGGDGDGEVRHLFYGPSIVLNVVCLVALERNRFVACWS